MSILDLHADTAAQAAPRYIQPPRVAPAPRFSAWSALPRGVGEAAAQVMATGAEIVAGFGDVMGRIEAGQPLTDRQPDMTSDFAELLRDRGREFRPDPRTASTAEQLLYGFARSATKVVGGAALAGPLGVAGAGVEEGVSVADDLARQGVDFETRLKAGAVQGGGLALAALPAVGQTLPATAALYLAGGPGGFMAQQALTREILQAGGYDSIAEQYDPFDPVGLAVSALVPAVFTAVAVRAQRRAAAVSRQVEDAARVALQAEQRQATNPGGSPDVHEAALVRAEDALARGDTVAVDGVEPPAAWSAKLADDLDALRRAEDAEPAPAAAPAAEPAQRPPIQPAEGATPAATAEAGATPTRLEQLRVERPDLMVRLDGMDAPMRLDDFLAAVKAEADELGADAPLMQLAAECALS